MNATSRRLLLIALVCGSLPYGSPSAAADESARATGVVFLDQNNNRKFDKGELPLADVKVSNGRTIVATDAQDFGLVSTSAAGPGLSIFQLNIVLFGVLIIVFLIFEPLGLYGIWIRIRNYWKAWPFSY